MSCARDDELSEAVHRKKKAGAPFFKEKGAGHSHGWIKKMRGDLKIQSALIELKICIVLQNIIADRMVLLSTPSFHSLCKILEHLEQSRNKI